MCQNTPNKQPAPIHRQLALLVSKLSLSLVRDLTSAGCVGRWPWRSAPVPERSNVGKRRRCNKIGFVGILGACCARGRAHSGAVTAAATDPTTCQAISSSKSSQDSGSLQTVMNGTSYEMILWWSDEDAAYVVEVPELPGCMTHGKTRPTPSARLRPPSSCGSERPRKTAWTPPRLAGVWSLRDRSSRFDSSRFDARSSACLLHSDFPFSTSSLGQPARTIPNPIESGCITHSTRTHARESAGLNICGGWGLASSTIQTTRILTASTSLAPECVRGWYSRLH